MMCGLGFLCCKSWLRCMVGVLMRGFYGFRGVTTEVSTAFRADEGGDSLWLHRRKSVNNNIFDPVDVVTRMAAILVPIAADRIEGQVLVHDRICHLVAPQ